MKKPVNWKKIGENLILDRLVPTVLGGSVLLMAFKFIVENDQYFIYMDSPWRTSLSMGAYVIGLPLITILVYKKFRNGF